MIFRRANRMKYGIEHTLGIKIKFSTRREVRLRSVQITHGLSAWSPLFNKPTSELFDPNPSIRLCLCIDLQPCSAGFDCCSAVNPTAEARLSWTPTVSYLTFPAERERVSVKYPISSSFPESTVQLCINNTQKLSEKSGKYRYSAYGRDY